MGIAQFEGGPIIAKTRLGRWAEGGGATLIENNRDIRMDSRIVDPIETIEGTLYGALVYLLLTQEYRLCQGAE